MALALRRPGRVVDYFVEPTADDITSPTIDDPIAAQALLCMRHEIDLPPALPPVPTYETRQDRRRRRLAFVVSLVGGTVALEILVRLVSGR